MGIFNSFAGNAFKRTSTYDQGLNGLLAGEIQQRKSLSKADMQRSALSIQAVSSRIMIADEHGVIASANRAALEMLKVAENDLQEAIPGFSVDKVIGQSIDIFHRNPAHQREMLAQLTETHQSRITVGPRTFELIVTPIFSDSVLKISKYRIGTVVEWRDITAKLAREKLEEQQHEQDRQNTRIRQALDVVTSNVMMADADNRIVYANAAVLDMLKTAESDLRRDLPDFRADNVIGNVIDIFHKNPEHQRRMLERLDKPFKTQIRVGGRTFSLIATPVYGSDQQRIGTVVEWQDNTAEMKKFEDLVSSAISMASSGRLSERLVTDGLTGHMLNFAEGFNNLMTIFETVVDDAAGTVKAMAVGDLTRTMQIECQGKFSELKEDINETIARLVEIMREIRESANSVKNGALEIATGNTNLSQRTEEQAASLEETSSAMEEVTATVQQNAENSLQANTLAKGARETAENGGQVVGRAVAAMQAISESSKKINDIISVIDEIAFQTNLLALNAAVEAARAGDQGRGFAVVADEVRNLAGRSAVAAKEIKELIQDSGEKVVEGAELVNRSGETLEQIVTAVKKVNDIVAEISLASDEQSTSLEEINRAVSEMDDVTQQNAALVEEAAAASESLGDQADALERLIAFFRTGEEDGFNRNQRASSARRRAEQHEVMPAVRRQRRAELHKPRADRDAVKPLLDKAAKAASDSRREEAEDAADSDRKWNEF